MIDVTNKWALITGANRGIGYRIAKFMAGIVVGAFIDDKKSGRLLGAQAFAGMTLEAAVKKAADFPQLFK